MKILIIGLAINVIGYAVSMLGYTIIGAVTYGVGIAVTVLAALVMQRGGVKETVSEPSPSDIKSRGIRRPGEEY